jgi:hypothetical protein
MLQEAPEMTINRRFRPSALLCAGALGVALGLGACGGGFDSAASGDHLIRDYVTKFGAGKVEVKSTNCPGGVAQKVGATYACKVVLHDKVTAKDHPGTITIHMAAGDKVEILGPQDLSIQ